MPKFTEISKDEKKLLLDLESALTEFHLALLTGQSDGEIYCRETADIMITDLNKYAKSDPPEDAPEDWLPEVIHDKHWDILEKDYTAQEMLNDFRQQLSGLTLPENILKELEEVVKKIQDTDLKKERLAVNAPPKPHQEIGPDDTALQIKAEKEALQKLVNTQANISYDIKMANGLINVLEQLFKKSNVDNKEIAKVLVNLSEIEIKIGNDTKEGRIASEAIGAAKVNVLNAFTPKKYRKTGKTPKGFDDDFLMVPEVYKIEDRTNSYKNIFHQANVTQEAMASKLGTYQEPEAVKLGKVKDLPNDSDTESFNPDNESNFSEESYFSVLDLQESPATPRTAPDAEQPLAPPSVTKPKITPAPVLQEEEVVVEPFEADTAEEEPEVKVATLDSKKLENRGKPIIPLADTKAAEATKVAVKNNENDSPLNKVKKPGPER